MTFLKAHYDHPSAVVLLLVPLLVLAAGDAAAGLLLARALALVGLAAVTAAVLAAGTRDRLLRAGIGAVAAALLAETAIRSFVRPLTTPSVALLAVTAAVLVAALLLPKLPAAWRAWLALVPFAGLAVHAATGFPAGIDPAGLLHWMLLATTPSLLVAVLAVQAVTRTPLPVKIRVLTAAAGVVALAAAGRQWLLTQLTEADLTSATADALAAAPGALRWLLVPAALLAALALTPVHKLKPAATGLLAFPLVAAIGFGAMPASLPMVEDPRGDIPVAEAAVDINQRVSQGMLADLGAGPRAEYRGMGFYDCDERNSRDCFITHYDDIAMRDGVAAAVDDVVSRVHNDQGYTFPAHCHQVVHNLGQLAYELSTEFADGADIDPQVCGTGYTHGLWEQQLVDLGTDAMFNRTGTLCDELNMTTPWYKWTCSHILGHMLSMEMMENPARALVNCTAIDDPQALTDCQAGGWMNFFQDDAVIARFRDTGSLEELFGVCYGAPQSVKFFCYQELFPVIYPMVGESDFLAGRACLDYAEQTRNSGLPWDTGTNNYADRCVQGLARAVSVSSFHDYRLVTPRCQAMPEAAQDPCLTAAAASIVLNVGSTQAGSEVCKNVSDQDYREYCYFWVKHSRNLLGSGPNSHNLPGDGEVRLPEGQFNPDGAPTAPVTRQ